MWLTGSVFHNVIYFLCLKLLFALEVGLFITPIYIYFMQFSNPKVARYGTENIAFFSVGVAFFRFCRSILCKNCNFDKRWKRINSFIMVDYPTQASVESFGLFL